MAAQLVLQNQIPRSHRQRLPLASHCESPALAQAEPMVGKDVTGLHWALAVPPVPEPPATG